MVVCMCGRCFGCMCGCVWVGFLCVTIITLKSIRTYYYPHIDQHQTCGHRNRILWFSEWD